MRDQHIQEALAMIYRGEGARVLSTLIRLLGDFDLAEDAMQMAFAAAVEKWPKDGIPDNPRAWLVSTGRFKAIDSLRRDTKMFAALREVASRADNDFPEGDEKSIEDDRLALIFTCCHPSLSREAQVALTLREVCGLTTEEIARAFLTSAPTIAQRIVRAKAKIREERIQYEVPDRDELPERIQGVLHVAYLLFNEGYYASSGDSLTRQVLSDEAIRLGRLLAELMPDPEVFGLLALMLLQESRRVARASSEGDVILLPDQDQSLWNHDLIKEGLALGDRSQGSPGLFGLQAAIAIVHIQGALRGHTDWNRIVSLYDSLLELNPSAVVELNRAVAVSMRDGPDAGVHLIEELLDGGALNDYVLAHSARADLLRRLGRYDEAGSAYSRALELATQAAERRFLEARISEVSNLAIKK